MNYNHRKITKDPIINWVKSVCPMCGEPTGQKSQCELIPVDERKRGSWPVVLQLFTPHCQFKESNLWNLHVNYPVSKLLIDRLSKVPGVDFIVPQKGYSIQLSIARMFNESEVKNKVTESYKDFYKTLQALELGSTEYVPDPLTLPNKIIAPNNATFEAKNRKEEELLSDIQQNMSQIQSVDKVSKKKKKEKGK